MASESSTVVASTNVIITETVKFGRKENKSAAYCLCLPGTQLKLSDCMIAFATSLGGGVFGFFFSFLFFKSKVLLSFPFKSTGMNSYKTPNAPC